MADKLSSDSSGYSDGDDSSSIMSKSDSEFSDSDYSDGEMEVLERELEKEKRHCTIL